MSPAPEGEPPDAAVPSPAPARWRGGHAAAVLVLCGAALCIHGLYCECFGCIGVGMAWFAWACVAGLVLAAGALAWWRLQGDRRARLVAGALALQLLSLAWLAWLWLWLDSRPGRGAPTPVAAAAAGCPSPDAGRSGRHNARAGS